MGSEYPFYAFNMLSMVFDELSLVYRLVSVYINETFLG